MNIYGEHKILIKYFKILIIKYFNYLVKMFVLGI